MSTFTQEQLLLEIRRNGYCVLPDVIAPQRCPGIRARVVEAVARQRRPDAPANVGFTPSIINHDQSFAEYLTDATLLGLIGALLGEHLRISFTSAIINEPGNERGGWHADWPFNQNNAGCLPAPYPDVVTHVTTLWMLSSFQRENGGTLVAPKSHLLTTNPTALKVGSSPDGDIPQPHERIPGEINVTGSAGSVLVMDSRLWHATAPNLSNEPRVALAIRYAPWWLNLEVLRPDSPTRKRMCDESGKSDNIVPAIRPEVFERLPADLKPLLRHWVERD